MRSRARLYVHHTSARVQDGCGGMAVAGQVRGRRGVRGRVIQPMAATFLGNVGRLIFSTEKRGLVGNNHLVARAAMPGVIGVAWSEQFQERGFNENRGYGT
jgi:hypothetical protein